METPPVVSSFQTSPLLKILNSALRDLPSPSTLHSLWNFGSLLGLCLLMQMASGLFLALHFSADISLSFEAVRHLVRDVNAGWLLRIAHANGARAFFLCLYVHVFRGLYFGSYRF